MQFCVLNHYLLVFVRWKLETRRLCYNFKVLIFLMICLDYFKYFSVIKYQFEWTFVCSNHIWLDVKKYLFSVTVINVPVWNNLPE